MKRTDVVMDDYLKNFLKFDLGHMDMDKYPNKILDINYFDNLNLDLYLSSEKGKRGVVLVIYGGGFVSGFKRSKFVEPMIKPVNKGYHVVVCDYTLALDEAYPRSVNDIKRCIDWIIENKDTYNFDINNISLWGESAGGYLALRAGLDCENKVKNIISFYPILDNTNRIKDEEALGIASTKNSVFDIFLGSKNKDIDTCPSYYLKDGSPNIFLQHGKDDKLVPYLQSERFYKEASKYKINIFYELVEGKVHTDPYFFNDENLEKILKFIG